MLFSYPKIVFLSDRPCDSSKGIDILTKPVYFQTSLALSHSATRKAFTFLSDWDWSENQP